MTQESTTIRPDILRSIDSAVFSGAFLPVGTPLQFPVRLIKFVNLSNVNVLISWDGVNNHEILPLGTAFTIDGSANRESSSNVWEIQSGTQFYVQGSPGTGFIYISCYYGR